MQLSQNESLTRTCNWSESCFVSLSYRAVKTRKPPLIPLINRPTGGSRANFNSSGAAGQGKCFADDFYGEQNGLYIQSRDASICVALSPRSAMQRATAEHMQRVFYTPTGNTTLRWLLRRLAMENKRAIDNPPGRIRASLPE